MRPGLVSVTFRQLSVPQILELAAGAGLRCIEWGGDIHVPSGDLAIAREVGRRTRDAGLGVTSYGSYYRLGGGDPKVPSFSRVLETAVALGAPAIRVWAGQVGSAAADEEQRARVADDARRAAELAQSAGIRLALEFHDDTLADSAGATLALLRRVGHPALTTLWQPPHGCSLDACVESLRALLPHLHHIHVFHWWPDHTARRPLAEGAERWTRYVEVLREAGRDPDFLLEFVPGDDPGILAREAATLRGWLET